MVNDARAIVTATGRERGIKRTNSNLDPDVVGERLAMPEPRKIFRIEETAASRLANGVADAQAPLRHAELMGELTALRALLAQPVPRQPNKTETPRHAETERLTSELNLIAGAIRGSALLRNGGSSGNAPPVTRIGHELEEVVNSSEQATQRVLAAAEEIDQVAKDLSATLTGKYEHGLTQDIQDLVIRIFEACNFQDLAGQRITKVLSILNFIEDHVTRMLEEIKNPAAARHGGAHYLHGPRLDSDQGHITQAEIDVLFGR